MNKQIDTVCIYLSEGLKLFKNIWDPKIEAINYSIV